MNHFECPDYHLLEDRLLGDAIDLAVVHITKQSRLSFLPEQFQWGSLYTNQLMTSLTQGQLSIFAVQLSPESMRHQGNCSSRELASILFTFTCSKKLEVKAAPIWMVVERAYLEIL